MNKPLPRRPENGERIAEAAARLRALGPLAPPTRPVPPPMKDGSPRPLGARCWHPDGAERTACGHRPEHVRTTSAIKATCQDCQVEISALVGREHLVLVGGTACADAACGGPTQACPGGAHPPYAASCLVCPWEGPTRMDECDAERDAAAHRLNTAKLG